MIGVKYLTLFSQMQFFPTFRASGTKVVFWGFKMKMKTFDLRLEMILTEILKKSCFIVNANISRRFTQLQVSLFPLSNNCKLCCP